MQTPVKRCGDRTAPLLSPIRVAHVDADTGVGAFATQAYQAGDSVLREAPYVFAQSYRTWNTTPFTHANALGKSVADSTRAVPVASSSSSCVITGVSAEHLNSVQRVRCCFGCGAPLPQCYKEECGRLDKLVALRQLTEVGCGERPVVGSGESRHVPLWDLLSSTRTAHYLTKEEEESEATSGAMLDTSSLDDRPAVSRAYVTEVDVQDVVHVVYFCGAACEARALHTDGKRFVLTPLEVYASATAHSSPPSRTTDEDEVGAMLRYPTYETILHVAQHPASAQVRFRAWPTRLSVLSTLHAVARRCNERVWLLVLLLAKELHCTLSALSSTPPPTLSGGGASLNDVAVWMEGTVANRFRARLEELCGRYAEGAMQLLTAEQKALLRFSWQSLTWWWVLCCMEAVVAPADTESSGNVSDILSASCAGEAQWLSDVVRVAERAAFPVQLYLQLYWLTNANVHMYVVVSPVYTLWCRWLAEDAQRTAETASDGTREEGSNTRDAKTALFARFFTLFHGADARSSSFTQGGAPSEDGLHATGVALYDTATKLNHSCAPNVCFQPNAGPVAASVVALRAIAAGEELLTSYIRLENVEEGDGNKRLAAQRRRRFLETHYGFTCCCPRCSAELEGNGNGS